MLREVTNCLLSRLTDFRREKQLGGPDVRESCLWESQSPERKSGIETLPRAQPSVKYLDKELGQWSFQCGVRNTFEFIIYKITGRRDDADEPNDDLIIGARAAPAQFFDNGHQGRCSLAEVILRI
jgi:hypothetical protein